MGAPPRSARRSRRFASARLRAAIAAIASASAFSALSLGAALAFGDGAAPPGESAPAAPTKAATPREYLELCGQGNAKFAKHDVHWAIDRYRAATTRFPDEPLAYALLGEGLLVAGNAADARAALTRGAAAGAKDAEGHVRVLVVLAVLEEHEHNGDAARAGWQAVREASQSVPAGGGASATAEGRLRVIDAVRQQAAVTDEVRKRIAATADGGVFSDPNKPAPDKAR